MQRELWINGVRVAEDDLDAHADAVGEDLVLFLREWWGPSPTVAVRTSGSTGAPKTFQAEKSRMLASARMTCDFLRLSPGDAALLCMPLRFIGAKMVVVRALERGMRLVSVAPSSHPLAGLDAVPDFAAMTPAQAFATLDVPAEARLLRRVRQLILGGSPVEAPLLDRLRDLPNAAWSTYGMTETLSHVALRRLNGPGASPRYTPLGGVRLSLDDDGALLVDAPAVHDGVLRTNDVADLAPDGSFRILGRRDNVINTGGIKVHPEEVEAMLAPLLPVPFLVSSIRDDRYGEAVVLLTEGGEDCDWRAACGDAVPRYARPKRRLVVDRLPRTASGKPDRPALRRLAARLAAETG